LFFLLLPMTTTRAREVIQHHNKSQHTNTPHNTST
jgi:hypothetical protein